MIEIDKQVLRLTEKFYKKWKSNKRDKTKTKRSTSFD